MKTVKRGHRYYVDCVVGGRRLRSSLGTQDLKTASRLRNRLEFAMADGPNSKVWAEIQPVLPEATYKNLSRHVGVPRQVALTWDELVSIFRKDKERGWARSTAKAYNRVLRQFGEYLSERGVFRVKNITREVISDYQVMAEERSQALTQYRNGAGLHNDLGLLCHVFKYAVEERLLETNPLRREKSSVVRRVTQPFNAVELARLKLFAEGSDALMYTILRWTGLRASDAVSLRWSSVNWTDFEIRNTNQKTGKEVIIPMSEELINTLVTLRPADEHKFILDVRDPAALYRRCKKLGDRAEVRDCRPHRFRDSLACDMLLRGASLYDVAKVLGNTVGVVESSYSPFVPALRSKLKQILDSNTVGLEGK